MEDTPAGTESDTESDGGKGPRCPVCGWTDVRRSMPKGFLDGVVRVVGLIPYRCRSCGQRFYRPGGSDSHL
jgi:DNA-directed RNA polymerase subunit RPC12/RpoP